MVITLISASVPVALWQPAHGAELHVSSAVKSLLANSSPHHQGCSSVAPRENREEKKQKETRVTFKNRFDVCMYGWMDRYLD